MNCPACGWAKTEVLRTMAIRDAVQRERRCACGVRFLTAETTITVLPAVAPTSVPVSIATGALLPVATASKGSATGSLPVAPEQTTELLPVGYRYATGSKTATGRLPVAENTLAPRNSLDLDLRSDPDMIRTSEADPDQTPARVSEPPAFAGFPIAAAGQTWDAPRELDEELAKAFPALDRQGEYAKARAWLVAAPARRKTAKGMPRFLYNWLERAQNSGPSRAARPAADDRCAFHRAYGTLDKLPASGAVEGCPRCKHVLAKRGTRQGEPVALGEMPAWAGRPATAEELEQLRKGHG